jgi:hypothetical protein
VTRLQSDGFDFKAVAKRTAHEHATPADVMLECMITIRLLDLALIDKEEGYSRARKNILNVIVEAYSRPDGSEPPARITSLFHSLVESICRHEKLLFWLIGIVFQERNVIGGRFHNPGYKALVEGVESSARSWADGDGAQIVRWLENRQAVPGATDGADLFSVLHFASLYRTLSTRAYSFLTAKVTSIGMELGNQETQLDYSRWQRATLYFSIRKLCNSIHREREHFAAWAVTFLCARFKLETDTTLRLEAVAALEKAVYAVFYGRLLTGDREMHAAALESVLRHCVPSILALYREERQRVNQIVEANKGHLQESFFKILQTLAYTLRLVDREAGVMEFIESDVFTTPFMSLSVAFFASMHSNDKDFQPRFDRLVNSKNDTVLINLFKAAQVHSEVASKITRRNVLEFWAKRNELSRSVLLELLGLIASESIISEAQELSELLDPLGFEGSDMALRGAVSKAFIVQNNMKAAVAALTPPESDNEQNQE